MDARDLPSISSPAARRLARAVASVLAMTIAWGLWQGYGALLSSSHVH
jgi:hypothetical protein